MIRSLYKYIVLLYILLSKNETMFKLNKKYEISFNVELLN